MFAGRQSLFPSPMWTLCNRAAGALYLARLLSCALGISMAIKAHES